MSWSTQSPRSFECRHHPGREGAGICVVCRDVICGECATKIQGMNYCVRCLQAASRPVEISRSAIAETVREAALLVFAGTGAVGAFFVLGVLLAMLRSAAPGGVPGS